MSRSLSTGDISIHGNKIRGFLEAKNNDEAISKFSVNYECFPEERTGYNVSETEAHLGLVGKAMTNLDYLGECNVFEGVLNSELKSEYSELFNKIGGSLMVELGCKNFAQEEVAQEEVAQFNKFLAEERLLEQKKRSHQYEFIEVKRRPKSHAYEDVEIHV